MTDADLVDVFAEATACWVPPDPRLGWEPVPMPTTRAWPVAITWLLAYEKRWADDPQDPGGPTKWGVSQAAHPGLDVRALSRADAERLLRREYWDDIRVYLLPPPLAVAVFDSAVHQGPRRAVALLQLSLGLPPDGKMGPDTAFAAWTAHEADATGAVAAFLRERSEAYSRGHKARYADGWRARLALVEGICGTLIP